MVLLIVKHVLWFPIVFSRGVRMFTKLCVLVFVGPCRAFVARLAVTIRLAVDQVSIGRPLPKPRALYMSQ